MENIGKALQEKRIALHMSVDDISVKTRLTPKHIKALEAGDISFFQDDLSYLRFFVKSYCEAIGEDFDVYKDELRNSIDEYTMTSVINTHNSHQEIERKVAKSDQLTRVRNDETTKHKRRSFRKPDFSLLSLIAIIGVVVLLILLAFILYIKSDASKPAGDANAEIPVAPEQEGVGNNKNPNTEEEETPTETEKKEMEITRKDATHYVLMNLEDGDEVKVDTNFIGSSSAYSLTVDGQVIESQVYKVGSTASSTFEVKKGTKFQVYIGFLLKTEIKINDKVVKLDDSMQSSSSAYTLEFTVGDSNEPAK